MAAGSTYVVDGSRNVLTLIAGPGTMNWGATENAPMILKAKNAGAAPPGT